MCVCCVHDSIEMCVLLVWQVVQRLVHNMTQTWNAPMYTGVDLGSTQLCLLQIHMLHRIANQVLDNAKHWLLLVTLVDTERKMFMLLIGSVFSK